MRPDQEIFVKERTLQGFGQRLASLRKSQGLTQTQLGEAVGVSQRVIAYYETDGAQPPGPLLAEFCRVLRVSSDVLLGIKPTKSTPNPKTTRLINRLRRIEKLPTADQRAVLKFVDALLDSRGLQ